MPTALVILNVTYTGPKPVSWDTLVAETVWSTSIVLPFYFVLLNSFLSDPDAVHPLSLHLHVPLIALDRHLHQRGAIRKSKGFLQGTTWRNQVCMMPQGMVTNAPCSKALYVSVLDKDRELVYQDLFKFHPSICCVLLLSKYYTKRSDREFTEVVDSFTPLTRKNTPVSSFFHAQRCCTLLKEDCFFNSVGVVNHCSELAITHHHVH